MTALDLPAGLGGLVVAEVSPGGVLRGEYGPTRGLVVEVRQEGPWPVDGRVLADEVAGLARRLYVAYERGYFEAWSEHLGRRVRGAGEVFPVLTREYVERCAGIVAEGCSSSGRVRVRARGMAQLEVLSSARGLEQVPRGEFDAEVQQAARAALDAHRAAVVRVKAEFFRGWC